MILLRSFDEAIKCFDYLSRHEKNYESGKKISGWYKFINNKLTGLLVLNRKLYFLHGDDKYIVNDKFRVLIESTEINSIKRFRLFNGEKLIVSFSYNSPMQKLNIPPFEYIDEEDFRWGEFIEKIINDENRKNNFIMNLMEE